MKLTVPTSWQDISIGQFINLHKIQKGELDNIDYMLQIIAVCCKVKYEVAARMSIADIKNVVSKLDFINVMPAQKKIDKVITLDREYICDLAVEKISAGQYIDLKNYVKLGAIDNIHNILTVFYIPIGEKYCQTPAPDIAKVFLEKMSIADAYPIAVFFWNLVKDSMEIIQDSLVNETMDQIRKVLELATEKTHSTSIGVG